MMSSTRAEVPALDTDPQREPRSADNESKWRRRRAGGPLTIVRDDDGDVEGGLGGLQPPPSGRPELLTLPAANPSGEPTLLKLPASASPASDKGAATKPRRRRQCCFALGLLFLGVLSMLLLMLSDFKPIAMTLSDPTAAGGAGDPRLELRLSGDATLGSGALHPVQVSAATCTLSAPSPRPRPRAWPVPPRRARSWRWVSRKPMASRSNTEIREI